MLVITAAIVALTNGFVVRPFGIRVSVTSAWRPLLLGLVILALRHVLLPRGSLVGRLRAAVRDPRLFESIPDAREAGLRPTVAETVGVIVTFVCITALVLHDQVARPDAVPDLGDPLFSIWRLAWVAHQLPRDPAHLFDANIFHPERLALAYSDAMLVPALVAAPALWLGAPRVLVYNVLLLGFFAISGATMFGLVRSLTGRRDAALVSGVIFAFYAYRFAHYSHLELQATIWMPLALLWLHRTARSERLRDGVITGGLVALQTLSSFYYGLFLILYMAGVVAALSLRSAWSARGMRALATGSVLCALIVVPVTVPYFRARFELGERSRAEVADYSAELRDYLSAPAPSRFYSRLLHWHDNTERHLFPGVVPVALAVVGLWPPLSTVRFAHGVGLAVATDASFGLNGLLYPLLYEWVLPYRALRVPARASTLVSLGLAVLAGFGVARLTARFRRSRLSSTAGVAIAAVALLEAWPVLRLEPVPKEAPAIYRAIPVKPPAVVVELPFPTLDSPFWIDPLYQYYSTFHWHRLVNGSSGFYPEWYIPLADLLQQFPSDRALEELRRHQVDYIVLHGDLYDPGRYAQLVVQAERRPDLVLVAVTPCGDRECRLYGLTP